MKCVTPVLQQEQLMENYPGFCFTHGAAAQTPKCLGQDKLFTFLPFYCWSQSILAATGLSRTPCQQDTSFDIAKLSLTQKDLYTTYPADDLH